MTNGESGMANEWNIAIAENGEQVRRCFVVMHELRPHLNEAAFVAQVQRQMAEAGYQLAMLADGGEVLAVAGFRTSECLAWGRYLYVDDLVTRAAARLRGCGGALFDWLVGRARALGCAQFHLDSGVQRFAAHRFYLMKRMDITSHHFCLHLGAAQSMPTARGGVIGA